MEDGIWNIVDGIWNMVCCERMGRGEGGREIYDVRL
jgi:hypothetical protein